MKLITTTILIFLLLTQVFSKWLLVIDYNLNKEYIAKTLCVNKEKPKLKCAGKCQLMKKMSEEESSNTTQGSQHAKNVVQETVFDDAQIDYVLPSADESSFTPSAFYLLKKYTSPLVSFFHPPSCA
jgi:hypothetical protein